MKRPTTPPARLFAALARPCPCDCRGVCYETPAQQLTGGGARPRVPKVWRRYGRARHRQLPHVPPGDWARDDVWFAFTGGVMCFDCAHFKQRPERT